MANSKRKTNTKSTYIKSKVSNSENRMQSSAKPVKLGEEKYSYPVELYSNLSKKRQKIKRYTLQPKINIEENYVDIIITIGDKIDMKNLQIGGFQFEITNIFLDNDEISSINKDSLNVLEKINSKSSIGRTNSTVEINSEFNKNYIIHVKNSKNGIFVLGFKSPSRISDKMSGYSSEPKHGQVSVMRIRNINNLKKVLKTCIINVLLSDNYARDISVNNDVVGECFSRDKNNIKRKLKIRK